MKKLLIKLLIGFLLPWTVTAYALPHEGYVKVPGAGLYYHTIGNGTPVIILHGGPGLDSSYLLPQMGKISQKYQAIFYDQRGSGKSIFSSLDAKYFNLNQFVEDLEQIRQTLGYDQVIIIGHSWGSLLAMAYAIKYPQHTKALILMNSAPATSAGHAAFAREYEKRVKPISKQIETIVKSPAFIQGDQKTFGYFCRLVFKKYLYKESDVNKLSLNFSSTTAKNQTTIQTFFSKELFGKNYNFTNGLNKLNIPTLMIHGDVDPIPLWTAKQTSEAIPNAKLIVIKNSGHFSYVENEKQVFTEINNFISRLN